MFQQDWILRQIEMIGVILARLLFGKDKPDYEIVEKEKLSDSDQLYIELIRMLDEGKINEAENRLYEELDPARLPMLELALAFYSRLNQFDDAYLEAHNYSRQEIEEGLHAPRQSSSGFSWNKAVPRSRKLASKRTSHSQCPRRHP